MGTTTYILNGKRGLNEVTTRYNSVLTVKYCETLIWIQIVFGKYPTLQQNTFVKGIHIVLICIKDYNRKNAFSIQKYRRCIHSVAYK